MLKGQIYRIRTVEQSGYPTAFLETTSKDNRIIEVDGLTEKLIFVMNVNYSHYALNSRDYRTETIKPVRQYLNSWLDRVFHRNDGYQTPLTVHPFRIEGNIDINNERDLTNQ